MSSVTPGWVPTWLPAWLAPVFPALVAAFGFGLVVSFLISFGIVASQNPGDISGQPLQVYGSR